MIFIIVGAVIFAVSIAVMVSCRNYPKMQRAIIAIVMTEMICVSGLLIAFGLKDMGLMG